MGQHRRSKADGKGNNGGGMPRGKVTRKVRERARLAQQLLEMNESSVAEQIARGALYDPGEYFYQQAGQELYGRDGPKVADCLKAGGASCLCVACAKAKGEKPALQWRKGDVRRTWQAGDLRPLHELSEGARQMITGVEVIMKNAVAGDGAVDRVFKLKMAPREKYVELAAKYLRMLIEQVAIVDAPELLKRMDAGRLRALERNRKGA